MKSEHALRGVFSFPLSIGMSPLMLFLASKEKMTKLSDLRETRVILGSEQIRSVNTYQTAQGFM